MNRSKKINWSKTLLAVAVTAGAVMFPELANASAGKSFVDVTTNITDSSATLPNLITTVAYMAGIAMAVFGILKLKGHVDNPGQVPIKDGLVRLGCGGALLALPVILEAMTATIGDDGVSTTNTALTAITYP